jgi:hypothetical protein
MSLVFKTRLNAVAVESTPQQNDLTVWRKAAGADEQERTKLAKKNDESGLQGWTKCGGGTPSICEKRPV